MFQFGTLQFITVPPPPPPSQPPGTPPPPPTAEEQSLSNFTFKEQLRSHPSQVYEAWIGYQGLKERVAFLMIFHDGTTRNLVPPPTTSLINPIVLKRDNQFFLNYNGWICTQYPNTQSFKSLQIFEFYDKVLRDITDTENDQFVHYFVDITTQSMKKNCETVIRSAALALKWLYRKGSTHGCLDLNSVCLTFDEQDQTVIESVKLFPGSGWRKYSHEGTQKDFTDLRVIIRSLFSKDETFGKFPEAVDLVRRFGRPSTNNMMDNKFYRLFHDDPEVLTRHLAFFDVHKWYTFVMLAASIANAIWRDPSPALSSETFLNNIERIDVVNWHLGWPFPINNQQPLCFTEGRGKRQIRRSKTSSLDFLISMRNSFGHPGEHKDIVQEGLGSFPEEYFKSFRLRNRKFLVELFLIVEANTKGFTFVRTDAFDSYLLTPRGYHARRTD